MLESEDFLPPSILKRAIQYHFKAPVIFKNSLKSWNNIPWTTEQLSAQYGETSLNFRVVPKTDKTISWEGTAQYVKATINQFMNWRKEQLSDQNCNSFHQFRAEDHWAYSSYNYLNDIFDEQSSIVKTVNWSMFGYPETPGNDSAFWIGSEGSYTPCHFDTYGFNFVAQIQGRKKWTLFPPEDTSFMYPTRIPYEESSVFSSVNILDPDFSMYPLFKYTHPHVIILEPGDVLFVPNKWWHFVQNLDITVSINTWMKLDYDKDIQVEEAVTRALMSSFISYFEPIGESWLNLNEELVSPEEALKYISLGLNKINSTQSGHNSGEYSSSVSQMMKVIKRVPESDVHSTISEDQLQMLSNHNYIKFITPEPFLKWYGKEFNTNSDNSSKTVNLKNIIDCFVHPEVISVICKLLKKV